MTSSYSLHRLHPGDSHFYDHMLDLFGRAFEEPEEFGAARPSASYRDELLADPTFIALAALDGETLVGALAAYEIRKFEQERREIYIYDLAVEEAYRRRGIATTLIGEVTRIARDRGVYLVMIQAEAEDAPAVALYSKLGTRLEAVHFDIAPAPAAD